MRPRAPRPVGLADALAAIGVDRPGGASTLPVVTGISLDSRAVLPGDVYAALPGAARHGAEFAAQALRAGAVAIVTDEDGHRMLESTGPFNDGGGVPVVVVPGTRSVVGPLARLIFGSGPQDGSTAPTLFAVTGTNGKTTSTYFLNALLEALGRSTGLIGTIEIRAGDEAIPSALTTPESPQVHSLLALMRERGLDAASMEVSSHALEFGRVDGVLFDVAGFTNLTQDHLDLHGTMEDYFDVKSALFTAERCKRAVVLVDDAWGRRLAATAAVPVTTLRTHTDPPDDAGQAPDWTVTDVRPSGLGHVFSLESASGPRLRLRTGLPGSFNVSNAALAAVMVLASGVPTEDLQRALDAHDPFTTEVPGRMQLIGEAPAAIVDFAHNPDALERTLASVRRPGGRVIAVFGATGQRDESKRPVMGAVGARLSDILIVTDDDPHDEDDAVIRRAVRAGAEAAVQAEGLSCEVLEVFPRADAIDRAVALARPTDTVIIAGRGHEVWQEVKGTNLALDDRVELRSALTRHGFSGLSGAGIES
ncbi:UDP-N-acetylmuramoyl-L-alanyl-D-glutamate--2,6-diaminopimelate ligase [Arthrobacter agilis]|uniref:UDP-N-acetylmuramoyl-L-alanyl-D-glutamate--2, 6-diaminopimelate ligase n=1 Tax=Arthrobacter agilis TaxID=37921 RepID=UPI000B363ADD|nr:UDP-N-acetylmuramoyl-L-alanyl-D-glutamate--2,6-diaminopimelate ligase [Arthrobacter agilis]PPB47041.1 UDP-N-acetylmuramoyl-L-alanyl-D-glutamate--2,6-diaminopimelate ligase [Arthrobacter agilis]TPV23420.1 UDP-N-acetylmuramoyl-L-alanyl-D-glutamate--2,6-diaminopimelate ligase [Arthrobacter agilis]